MKQTEQGLQVWDKKGNLLVEVGPHVIRKAPKFAEKIGVIAASWAHAEVNLNCLFAFLLDTTPEEAAKKLKKYGNAAKATEGARTIAKSKLTGSDLDSVIEVLEAFDKARLQRNRLQHDTWAKKGNESLRMFAVHSKEYLDLTLYVMASANREAESGPDIEGIISRSMRFAETLEKSYTLDDLQSIAVDIDTVSKDILQLLLSLLMSRCLSVENNTFEVTSIKPTT